MFELLENIQKCCWGTKFC